MIVLFGGNDAVRARNLLDHVRGRSILRARSGGISQYVFTVQNHSDTFMALAPQKILIRTGLSA